MLAPHRGLSALAHGGGRDGCADGGDQRAGCRQVVDDGVTGLLVPVRDATALAAAIATLADSSERRLRFGRAAHEKATRDFDQQRCVAITLETYRRLLARRVPSLPAAAP